ncbi:hypothetical protein LP420_01500 [Massilia sp. B-10]|nr:hypothetical protein LP420_01500 [Massilia sp. B-10]
MNIPGKIKSITSALKERKQVRKELRGPADLYYAIADAIEMLDRDAWQELAAPSGFFMSAPYLHALEKVLPLNLSPRYALVYSGVGEARRPLAAIYMQVADVSLSQLRPEKTRRAPGRTGQEHDPAHPHLRQSADLRPARHRPGAGCRSQAGLARRG